MKYFKDTEGKVFAYELDGSQDHLIPENYISITEEDALDNSKKLEKETFDALSYSEKRVLEYPALSDLADALYWQSQGDNSKFDEYIIKVSEVKLKYPKN